MKELMKDAQEGTDRNSVPEALDMHAIKEDLSTLWLQCSTVRALVMEPFRTILLLETFCLLDCQTFGFLFCSDTSCLCTHSRVFRSPLCTESKISGQVAPILMRETSRKAREGGAADVSKDAYERVPVEAGSESFGQGKPSRSGGKKRLVVATVLLFVVAAAAAAFEGSFSASSA